MALRSGRSRSPSKSQSPSGRSGKPKTFRSNPRRPKRRPASYAENSFDQDKSGERLQKLLAAAGLGSRRACEELILTGRVEVDRKVVSTLGTRVDPVTQEIRVDGEALPQPRLTYVLVHKIQGVVSTANDPSGRPRVTDMVPPELGRLFPVGRLDMSSEGLILLTNDGELANKLTHPRYGVEKMYHVQVAGKIEQETLDELEKGVYLAEGVAKVVGVSIKSHHKNSTILEMILDEGRNREIRRLLARVGHKVQRLTRVAMGPLKLGDVPPGAYRLLRHDEIKALQESVDEVPAGRRAKKRPGAHQGGSRKLLQQRKAGDAKPAASQPETSPGKRSGGKPARANFKPAKPADRPKTRTIISDDAEFEAKTSTGPKQKSGNRPGGKKKFGGTGGAKTPSPGKFGVAAMSGSKPGESKPGGGKAKRKGKPVFRTGRSKGQ